MPGMCSPLHITAVPRACVKAVQLWVRSYPSVSPACALLGRAPHERGCEQPASR